MAKVKNVPARICAVILLSILLIGCLVILRIYKTTMSNDSCIEYCQQNSKRFAQTFENYIVGVNGNDYKCLIALDGDWCLPQEIFVFRRKWFGPFARYQFVASSTQAEEKSGFNTVGSLMFQPRKDDGSKESGYTLLFYASTERNNIVGYEYTLTENGKSEVIKEGVRYGDESWIEVHENLGYVDEDNVRLISNVRFYDKENNVVATFF